VQQKTLDWGTVYWARKK